MTVLALDLSNYTSPLSSAQVQSWQAMGVGLAIIQAWPGRVADQLRVCAEAGLPIDGYVFVYPGDSAALIQGRLALLNGYSIRRLWLDVELPGVTQAEVQMALNVCDRYPTRLNPTGIYTGHWYWTAYNMKNTQRWSDRPLWDSNYDNRPDAGVNFHPYGGWTSPLIKQYAGTSTLAGVGNVDLDVLSVEDAATLTTPVVEVPMSLKPGEGMVAQMRAHADSPLFGHKFWTETDDDGNEFSVEECFGSFGRYVSSNSSGNWINAGPF